jgi:molecular chaperone DnaJ
VPVPYPTMALGGSFKVDGPAGPLTVELSPGTPSGSVVSFRGKGMPSVTGRGKGAFHVRAVVEVPKKLSKEQKKLVEQLGQTMTVDELAATPADADADKPFFEKVKDLFG